MQGKCISLSWEGKAKKDSNKSTFLSFFHDSTAVPVLTPGIKSFCFPTFLISQTPLEVKDESGIYLHLSFNLCSVACFRMVLPGNMCILIKMPITKKKNANYICSFSIIRQDFLPPYCECFVYLTCNLHISDTNFTVSVKSHKWQKQGKLSTYIWANYPFSVHFTPFEWDMVMENQLRSKDQSCHWR